MYIIAIARVFHTLLLEFRSLHGRILEYQAERMEKDTPPIVTI